MLCIVAENAQPYLFGSVCCFPMMHSMIEGTILPANHKASLRWRIAKDNTLRNLGAVLQMRRGKFPVGESFL